jgi:aspartokinase
MSEGFKGKTVETIAVYWEPKPKTYGFKEVFDLSLMTIEIEPEKIIQWGLWLMELADLDIGFHLILAKYSTHQKLGLYILLEKFVSDSVLSHIDKRIDPESEKKIHLTSPVELISFQGPHFGDRYGIADSAFKALDGQGVPVLITVCSGAAVYIVLPEKKLKDARPLLLEAFVVP